MKYILNQDVDGSEITLKMLQDVLLDMMKDIDKILKKNHIEYTLFSGTALGAVRHKGFIPWDDDLDIAIMRSDYDKLLEVLKKDLPKKYIFQCFDTDNRYCAPYPALKIRLKDTYIEEKNRLLKNKCDDSTGIFIDVFLLNYVSSDRKEDRKWRKKNLWLSFLITFLENLDINPVSLKQKFIQNAIDYGKENKNSKLIGDEITWVYRSIDKPYIYKKEDIFPTKRVKFESLKLPIPNNPDGFLRPHYGDNYMVEPKNKKPTHIVYVSMKSDCKERNRFHFQYQNLAILLSIVVIIFLLISLFIFDDKSFVFLGLSIILIAIILKILINKKN